MCFHYNFNLCKVTQIIRLFLSDFQCFCGLSAITANGLALGAVADFGAQNCQYTTKVDAR